MLNVSGPHRPAVHVGEAALGDNLLITIPDFGAARARCKNVIQKIQTTMK